MISTIILLLGVMVFIFNPLQLNAQKKTVLDSIISYKAKNISLYQGLNEIGNKIGYNFSYNADLVASQNEIKVNYENISVFNLLSKLLNDTTLTYKVADKQIVICKKNLINNLVARTRFNNNQNIFQINGIIYSQKTKKPLAFANIALYGKSIGTVTNEQGNFNLKLSYKNISDTIVISYIGYKNTYIPVNQLSYYNNKIYLNEDHLQIQEVVIRSNDARKILEKALNKIKDNYYTDPYFITSFYREIVTNRDKLASITEAVLKVYKSPYSGLYSDQVKLIKSRKNEYFNDNDTVSLKLKGGLYASLALDAIKNPSYFLMNDYLPNFNYEITDIVKFDNNSAYVISFNPRLYMEDFSFEGKIYINTDNLAIVAIEFNLTQNAINKYGSNLVVKKGFGTNVKPKSVRYLINYRKINGKYFINLARGELNFKVKQKKKLFSTDFKTVFEFATNNIDTLNVHRFNRIETISAHDIFIDEDDQYDTNFWGDYNYIRPDETLEEALVRIQKKLDEIEQK